MKRKRKAGCEYKPENAEKSRGEASEYRKGIPLCRKRGAYQGKGDRKWNW